METAAVIPESDAPVTGAPIPASLSGGGEYKTRRKVGNKPAGLFPGSHPPGDRNACGLVGRSLRRRPTIL